MSDILSQIFTLPVQIFLALTLIIIILLWLLSILWVNRDARQRDTSPMLWTIVAIIPVAGLVAYCLLRPPLTRTDSEELEMEMSLLQRQLDQYDTCPHCGYPTESDFVVCPSCRKQLRNVCSRCGRTLKPEWAVCPYCTTPVNRSHRRSAGESHQAHRQASSRDAASVRAAAAARNEARGGKDPFEPNEG